MRNYPAAFARLATFVGGILLAALLLGAAASPGSAGSRDSQWASVDKAAKAGLPKTAVELLDPIIAGSLADKAYPEAVKAITRKITLERTIADHTPESSIQELTTALERAPAPMRPMMEALLAHWYWQYFVRNRWQLLGRTPSTAVDDTDLRTWDQWRLLAEVDARFTTALSDEAALKAIPIGDWDELIPQAGVPDAYRPTLYDFLAHEAIEFYAEDPEPSNPEAEDAFELKADSPIFADAVTFESWRPKSEQPRPPIVKAIDLYQDLLRFHQRDSDPSAFLDADLSRIQFGMNCARGDARLERAEAALQRFAENASHHEISSVALAILARTVWQRGAAAEGHHLAESGFKAFPASAGGALCYNLIQQIEAKLLVVQTESTWNEPWPTIEVTYRNVGRVYFRAIPAAFTQVISNSIDLLKPKQLRGESAVLEWAGDLPDARDYGRHVAKLPAPSNLKPGLYHIVASADPDFRTKDNQLSATQVWVTNLSLIVRSNPDHPGCDGFVLMGKTGEPVAGANVQIFDPSSADQPVSSTISDENGRFHFSNASGNDFVVLAEHGGQAISMHLSAYFSPQSQFVPPSRRILLLTDRGIYRPGQTIAYKGIAGRFDTASGNYSVEPDREVTVLLLDASGRELSRAVHTTNDYGSFSGTFAAPHGAQLGRMSICDSDHASFATFNVEEYKRPKFEVELAPPVEAPRLTSTVTVVGKATAYTGAAVDGARVRWRVERNVTVPYWNWSASLPIGAKSIAHGTSISQRDGTFEIRFLAEPDAAIPKTSEAVYSFSVHADVTDTDGESHSEDRLLQIGYASLRASIVAADWETSEKPVEFSLTTESLDGSPQAAGGELKIFTLLQPPAVARDSLGSRVDDPRFEVGGVLKDASHPSSWAADRVVAAIPVHTGSDGTERVSAQLRPGIYRAIFEARDAFGQVSSARRIVTVFEPDSRHWNVKVPDYLAAPKWTVEPGETFTALWGTGYAAGRAFVEIECAGETIRSYWTSPNRTQELIEVPVTEQMRGGFTLRVTSVREDRACVDEHVVGVPWSNKRLTIKWLRFRSKLLPGQKETWTAVVSAPDGKSAPAEVAATLYDASLEQLVPHRWPESFDGFRVEFFRTYSQFGDDNDNFLTQTWWKAPRTVPENWTHRAFPPEVASPMTEQGGSILSPEFIPISGSSFLEANLITATGGEVPQTASSAGATLAGAWVPNDKSPGLSSRRIPDLEKISARSNLSETAFFFPQLMAGADGKVRISFTAPESLTEWRFMAFAHDKDLRAGLLTDTAVTAKDLMVQPNPPRFVREGDTVEFTVKVSNQSDAGQTGAVRLTFSDASSMKSVDAALANRRPEQTFDVPAGQSRSYSWRITVPDSMGFLAYKAVASTGEMSDGEEGYLPVLSRRVLVTESLPLDVRGKGTKHFEFDRLVASGGSGTLRNQSLTVQMTSHPAWYAVLSLPYLMEFPQECSEQIFNRYYANELGRHIVASNPRIRRIFEVWKNQGLPKSPLEANEDLKSVMLQETPWVGEATSEDDARQRVGLLFDSNRMDDQSQRALRQLADRQLPGGLWSWFPGEEPSEYISLYIMTGFGRLRHLGVETDAQPALRSLAALDDWIDQRYGQILESAEPAKYVPGDEEALYLYGRSFFLADHPIATSHRPAVDFLLGQARKYWTRVPSRQSQAHLALALQRFGDTVTPLAILKSLKERSAVDEQHAMHWRDSEPNWCWYEAPIETQAMMIEAFAEVGHDTQAVEDCKAWLLEQKRTQNWETTKATADAVYALLLTGRNLLADDAPVAVSLGGTPVRPDRIETGTGFYERRFSPAEISPSMGHITVTKTDDGLSWGGIHWQYLEDMAKITPYRGTPLQVKKTLFIEETTSRGRELVPVTGPLAVGDKLVVRIVLRADRDMEYVHLRDERGSGTEPENVLSGYHYQDGLGYYESTRDTATDFYIDRLPQGTYVLDYAVRVQLRGAYQSGMAEAECMYAPEFNSHSGSTTLEVR